MALRAALHISAIVNSVVRARQQLVLCVWLDASVMQKFDKARDETIGFRVNRV